MTGSGAPRPTDRTGRARTLQKHPLTRRQWHALLLTACGEFIDGYDFLVMGAALLLLRPEFGLTPAETGALGGSTFIGAVVGLLVFGDITDRVGRRAVFVVNLLFFVVFSVASAFVTSVPELFAARFLVGVGVGMEIPASAAYIAEVAPKEVRGAFAGSLVNLAWALGALASTLLAIPLIKYAGDSAWRWMFGIAAVPAALVLLGRQTLPDSPRWLAAHGRLEEAKHTAQVLGTRWDDAWTRSTGKRGTYIDLLQRPWRLRVIVVGSIFFLNSVTGSLATIAAPYVLDTVGHLSERNSLEFATLIWCTNMVGVAVGALLIDRIGRRRLFFLAAIPQAITAAAMAFLAVGHSHVLVLTYFVFAFFTWLGPAVIVWAWASELFPTFLRGKSQGICNGMGRVAVAVNIFIIPVGVASVGFTWVVLGLAVLVLCMCAVVGASRFLDAEGVPLEQLATGGK